jgi:cell division protein FtsB
MHGKQAVLMILAVSILFSMLVLIFYGEGGLNDLNALKMEKSGWEEKNKVVEQENFTAYREIYRLKNDPSLIESLAKQELGLVEEKEIIFKIQPSLKQGVSSQ